MLKRVFGSGAAVRVVWSWAAVVLAMLLAVAEAGAQGTQAAGGPDAAWLIRSQGASLQLHRLELSPSPTLWEGPTLQGTLLRRGYAAGDDRLWLIYSGRTVQSVRARRVEQPGAGSLRQYETRRWPSIPEGLSIHQAAEAGGVLWLLGRVENRAALARIDAAGVEPASGTEGQPTDQADDAAASEADATVEQSPATDDSRGEAGDDAPQPDVSPDASSGSLGNDAVDVADEQGSSAELGDGDGDGGDADGVSRTQRSPLDAPIPQDRLLQLYGSTWRPVALPDDWPHPANQAWAVGLARFTRPVLVRLVSDGESTADSADEPVAAVSTAGDALVVRVYWPSGASGSQPGEPASAGRGGTVEARSSAWEAKTYRLVAPRAEAPRIEPMVVDGELVIAVGRWRNRVVRVWSHAIRRDVSEPIALPAMEIDAVGEATPWVMAGCDRWAVLAVGDPAGPVRWSRVDLRGGPAETPEPLELTKPTLPGFAAGQVVFLVVLVLATLLMLLPWRRETRAPATPIAGLGPRTIAGLIDLAPWVVITVYLFRLDADSALAAHPVFAQDWHDMLPFAACLLPYLACTLAGELIAGRSLGKAVMRLRVADLSGGRASSRAIVIRNVTRVLDLVAIPLLLMPAFSPLRQRLGDLVGQTLLVSGGRLTDDADERTSDGDEPQDGGGARK